MGYTHHWEWKSDPVERLPASMLRDVRKIIKARRDILAGPLGEGAPITGKGIRLNGRGDEGHETFSFGGPDECGYGFCKTARKPYDVVVVALLLIARDYFPDYVLEVRSDGNLGDWADGIDLYREVTNRTPRIPEGVTS